MRCSALILGATAWLAWSAHAADDLPRAEDVVERVLARARFVAQEQTNGYAYDKRTVVSELDAQGRARKKTEKLHRVTLIGGLPFTRLVKVQGRDLTPQELEKENQREIAFRRKMTSVDLDKKAARKEPLATPELMGRFDFRVMKREWMEGRPVLAVSFEAKPTAPDKTIEDRVYKRVAGTVWVDEADSELVKIDARLREAIPLGWFGAIGSLNQFHAVIERIRMPDGAWMNRRSSFHIVARKLLAAMRMQVTEESTGFHRQPATAQAGLR